ncbi:MAG: AAA family ATPase [Candidatus Saccharibacteria bacterium]|nr:AAA family ATPase [Candidatus Saccharibacteria bacterium]
MDSELYIRQYLNQQLEHGHQALSLKLIDSQKSRLLIRKLQRYIQQFLGGEKQADRWVIIPGLRGVGKTTILAQTYIWLEATHNIEDINLIYISLDEIIPQLNSNLNQVMQVYAQVLGHDWINCKKPTFVFIDEVQLDINWAQTLKVIYDKNPNLFFICSGSSATYLQLNADVAGRRAIIERLYPLAFTEYQLLAYNKDSSPHFKDELMTILYYSDSADIVFKKLKQKRLLLDRAWAKYDSNNLDHYLTMGTMPFALHQTNREKTYIALRGMIDQVINNDIQAVKNFNQGSLAVIRRLMFLLADSDDVVSLETLGKVLGVDKKQIWEMLDTLLKTELLIKVNAYGNHYTATRKPARYHFMSPAIRLTLASSISNRNLTIARRGRLLEDIVSLYYYQNFAINHKADLTYPYSVNNQKNCDFILKILNSHNIALEFSLGKKDIKQLVATMKTIDCRYGLVFSDSNLKLIKDQNIIKIPIHYFFLS